MSISKDLEVDKIYKHFKNKNGCRYKEAEHCKLLIKVMMNKDFGCISTFCVQAMITDSTFYNWVRDYELFRNLYLYCKMVAKQIWYEQGRIIANKEYAMGHVNYEMEHWKLMGWAKFGISKNSRIKINFDVDATPAEHYKSVLMQAAEGDFTASEFKQLMEAINVGINVHQIFELQKQIDELKSDMAIMAANKDVDNPFSNKRDAEKN
jgi:hypothetical protein